MKFKVFKTTNAHDTTVFYSKKEQSFFSNPNASIDIAICMAYLELGIDSISLQAKTISGFSPQTSWVNIGMGVPVPTLNGELMLYGSEISSGFSYRIDNLNSPWKSHFDCSTGWFCIGNTSITESDICIRFLRNAIAIVGGKQIKSLWILSEFVE